jgi:hypothetical protein
MSAILSGGRISDYADVSNFGGEGVSGYNKISDYSKNIRL